MIFKIFKLFLEYRIILRYNNGYNNGYDAKILYYKFNIVIFNFSEIVDKTCVFICQKYIN